MLKKMDIRPTIPLILSIALGTAAALMAKNYVAGERKEFQKDMEPVNVVVAERNIPANTPIERDMLAQRAVPKKFVHGNAIYPEEGELLYGRELLYPVRRGDPILWMDFKGGERYQGFSSMIREGERALTLSVIESSTMGGLLQPGDHIDILGTFTSRSMDPKAADTENTTTITLLQNVVVLGVGKRTSARSGRLSSDEDSRLITVLVTPEEAELLVHAENAGTLCNILRNPGDIESIENLPRITSRDILQPRVREDIQTARDNRILIIRGGEEASEKVE